jgi:HupE / UreJ protein
MDGGRKGAPFRPPLSRGLHVSHRNRMVLLAWTGLALTGSSPALSHEFSMESVMNAFVAIEPGEAHLVIRLPLHLLKPVQVPLRDREIDLDRAGPAIEQALKLLARSVVLFEDGRALVPSTAAGRFSLPSDRSFDEYADAVSHVALPSNQGIAIYAGQGHFDAHLTYPIASPLSRFSIRTTVAPELKDYLKLSIRYLPLGEPGRPMLITSRSGIVWLNPAWYRAAGGFVALGIAHIVTGIDHLLFLVCLVIPLLRLRQVVSIVTAFTVAHSFTLLGSAYGLSPTGAWFPPFVETAIAASIVYMALENIAGIGLDRRWLITGLFGLVHGFGFSYGLKENLQFAGSHLLVSLFSFNVGIEIGQLAILAVVLPTLALLRRHVLAQRAGVIVLSALVGHTGWHWMTERADVLWKTDWPRLDAAALATLARWTAGLLLAAGAARLVARRASTLLSRRTPRERVS